MSKYKKCLSCEYIPCADFLCKKDELEGGELYVLNECIKQKKIMPCQSITPLHSCCMLCKAAYKTLDIGNEYVPPLLFLTWHCLPDLKASAFLALSAHYRNAIQILRPVIENILVGLYFEKRLNEAEFLAIEDEINQVYDDYNKWADGEYKISEEEWKRITGKSEEEWKRRLGFGFLLEWLFKEGVLTGKGKSRLGEKIQGPLNKYLHPYLEQMEISKCPATTRYDEDRYNEWFGFFQDTVAFVKESIHYNYCITEETADGKEASGYLKNLESLEKRIENTNDKI